MGTHRRSPSYWIIMGSLALAVWAVESVYRVPKGITPAPSHEVEGCQGMVDRA